MPDWIVAQSLDQLRAQLDDLAPRRSRASDGAIGDAAHATRDSDHNPWVVLGRQRYVTARDFTHDPAGGLNAQLLADSLRRGRDPRVKYVIWNRQIMSGAEGREPWAWRRYTGSNPHTAHLHLSVVADLRATVRVPWTLPALLAGPGRPGSPTPEREDDDMTPAQAQMLAEIHGQLLGGWPSWDGGTNETRTLVDFARRNNVEVAQLHRNLNDGVHRKLDQVLAVLASLNPADHAAELAPGLDEVRTLIREALADLGPLHLTAKEATS